MKVLVYTRHEFLALGLVGIGGSRLVSRPPVPPPPRHTERGSMSSVDRVARTQLPAPKTLGFARRSLRLVVVCRMKRVYLVSYLRLSLRRSIVIVIIDLNKNMKGRSVM